MRLRQRQNEEGLPSLKSRENNDIEDEIEITMSKSEGDDSSEPRSQTVGDKETAAGLKEKRPKQHIGYCSTERCLQVCFYVTLCKSDKHFNIRLLAFKLALLISFLRLLIGKKGRIL